MRGISGRESLGLLAELKSTVIKSNRGRDAEPGLAEDAAAAGRSAHGRAIEVFAKIHQGKKSAEDAGFQVVGEGHAAGGDACQLFPAFGDEAHDFTLAIVRSIAKRGFAAHFRATGFQ
jgi:hypothetical protein